jgi:hypothetical protein
MLYGKHQDSIERRKDSGKKSVKIPYRSISLNNVCLPGDPLQGSAR